MSMTINYIEAGRIEWSDFWKGSFQEAREVATTAVQSHTCDHAEIRSSDGRLIFHFPRLLRAG